MKQKRFHGSGVDLSSLQSQIELVVVLCCFELATAQKTWESRVQNFSDACEVWTECHQVPQANCNLHSFFPKFNTYSTNPIPSGFTTLVDSRSLLICPIFQMVFDVGVRSCRYQPDGNIQMRSWVLLGPSEVYGFASSKNHGFTLWL